jgi:putative ABC transport system permease protein
VSWLRWSGSPTSFGACPIPSLAGSSSAWPSPAAGGGHLGASAISQVLIGASPGTSPAALTAQVASLSASYPGLQVSSRSVANAQYLQSTSQDSYVDNLLLSLIGLLVGVALVNTLVVATLRHRDELEMLTRVGATTRQLLATMTCQAAAVTLIGIVLGIAAQLATVTAVSTMLTGSPVPSIPWSSVIVILGVVALLTALSILAPTTRLVMRHKDG